MTNLKRIHAKAREFDARARVLLISRTAGGEQQ